MRLHLRHRGFSLAEVLVTMGILGILGVALTRLLLTQGRFADHQNALRNARAVSRQSLNVMLSDLRMVQDSGGIDSAATDGKAIRVVVPYRFGLNCGIAGGKQVVSMLPVDSLVLAQSVYAGYGWRNALGRYTLVYPTNPLTTDAPVATSSSAQCTGNAAGQAQIRLTSIAGRTGTMFDLTPTAALAPQGQAIFLFQRITYSFAASTAFPGKIGLWRTIQGGASEEIVAPFDADARFRYWTAGADTSVTSPPALSNIRGVDVVFSANSTYTPSGRTSAAQSKVVTSMFFKNVRNY
jgi:prepilin-type N-terminal cleavage/methylation domain-containing protein